MSSIPKKGARRGGGRAGNTVNFGLLDELTGYAIKRAHERVFEAFMAATPDPHVTPPRYAALMIIASNGDLTQTDLAESLGIARSGAAAMVKALQDLGYVSQAAADGDRRAVSLALTPAGRIALDAVTTEIRKNDAALTASFAPDELKTFLALLERVGL